VTTIFIGESIGRCHEDEPRGKGAVCRISERRPPGPTQQHTGYDRKCLHERAVSEQRCAIHRPARQNTGGGCHRDPDRRAGVRKHGIETQQSIRCLEGSKLRRIMEVKRKDERHRNATGTTDRGQRRPPAALLPQPAEGKRQQQKEVRARRKRNAPERACDVGVNRAGQPP